MSNQPLSLPSNFWVNSGCREVLSMPLDFECQSPFAVLFEGICAHQKGLDIDPWLVSCDTFHGFFSSVGDSKPAIYQPSGLRVWVQMLRESQILSKLHDVSQVLNSQSGGFVGIFVGIFEPSGPVAWDGGWIIACRLSSCFVCRSLWVQDT